MAKRRPIRLEKVYTTTAETNKDSLRREIRAQLSRLPEEARRQEDKALFARFLSRPEVAQAKTLFLFYGVGTEPETSRLFPPLLEQGKVIGLPRMLPSHGMQVHRYLPDESLISHPFGIPEPVEDAPVLTPEEIDLVLVPALCYDRRGFRLGMGGGYYDRWLEHYHGVTVGLCRRELLYDHLPVLPYDRPVDLVITPEYSLSCARE